MSTSSWWMIDDPAPLDLPRFEGTRIPVAIIGGGLAGWSAAYWLKRRGVDCVVVDPGDAPSGASARNAGFLMTGTAYSYAESIRMWGRDEARRLERLSWDNRERLATEILSRHDCEAARTGTWRLAESAEELAEVLESHALLAEDGFDYRWIGEEEAGALGARFLGGLEQEGDWCLHPRKLVRAIARESATPRFQGAVEKIERSGHGATLILRSGQSVEAERIVVTLNGYASSLIGEVAGVRPIRAQVMVTAPYSRSVWMRPVYSHYGYFYFRQLRDGRLLVGGARHLFEAEETGLEDATTPGLQSELEAFLASIVEDAPPAEHRWSGVMGFTEDSRPRSTTLGGDPAILLLAGFNGHGVGLAFETARLLIETEFA